MPINRKIWRDYYGSFGKFTCPRCCTNRLVEKKDSEIRLEPNHSLDSHGEDWWDPELIIQRFAIFLQCPQKSCGEIVVVTGSSFVESDYSAGPEGYEQYFYDSYRPRFMNPPPPIIDIPDEVSAEVKGSIQLAFGLFWVDKTSCLNALRRCVEILMDEAKIPKTSLNKNKKRIALNLHARIKKFETKDANVAEILMALKWLGNEGSHATKGEAEIPVVLDAFEILEHALEEIYSSRKKKIAKKVKGINKKKGS